MRTLFFRCSDFIRQGINRFTEYIKSFVLPMSCICMLFMVSCKPDKYDKLIDWDQRQSAIVQLIGEGDFDKYDELMVRWLSEPGALMEELEVLQDSIGLFRAESADGRLHVFSWYTIRENQGFVCNNVIHYEENNEWYTTNCSLWQLMQNQHEISKLALHHGKPVNGCATTRIIQVKDQNDNVIYLTENYLTDTTWEYGSIDAFTIKDGKLVQVPELFVNSDRQIRDNLEYSYYMNTYNDILGPVVAGHSVFGWDENTRMLLCPTEEFGEFCDRYESYEFNGSKFVYTGNKVGKNLHPSLCDFEVLAGIYWTGHQLIRIDRMQDGTYRYASWYLDILEPIVEDMEDEPELVIHGGTLEDGWYQFSMGEFTYKVDAYSVSEHVLQIYCDGVLFDVDRYEL